MMLSFVNIIVVLGLLTPNLSIAYKTSFYTSSEFGIEGKPAIKDCSAILESIGGTASIDRLECLLSNEFSLPRHHTVNPQNKEKTRSFLLNSMKQYADEVAVQSFDQPGEVDVKGTNIIATIAGTKRNTSDDNLVLIGAHYDTFLTPNDVTAGIDDNGSGLAVLLEVLRLVSAKYRANPIKPTNSIMFVAFDFEEYGYVGSQLFVNNYLIPYELTGKKSASFQGAFIMDTIMNYNTTKGAQLLPDLVELIAPEIENWVNNVNEKMGDFLTLISRETLDTSLTNAFVTHWKSVEPDNSFKMLPVNFPVEYEEYAGELLRSDHASFWYHDFTKYEKQLPAVFLTDTGNYRGVMIDCYHKACDDSRLITKENLSWLQQIADTLFKSIVSLAD